MTGPVAGFGFSTQGTTPDLGGLDDTLSRIAASGAGFAELALFDFDLILEGRIIPERARRLEAICARHPLRYTVHGSLAVNLMDQRSLGLHKSVCRAMLDLTAAVGASLMVHHAGRCPTLPAPELERRHALERDGLLEMGEAAAELGVRLGVECLFVDGPEDYTPDPIRLARELMAIDHEHVVGTLDFSHALLTATRNGLDYRTALDAFAPVAGHLHVHDSFGRPPTVERFYASSERLAFGMGDLHLPPGWGAIPWDEILPGLPVRDGTILTVELPGRYWGELDQVAATAGRFVSLINGEG